MRQKYVAETPSEWKSKGGGIHVWRKALELCEQLFHYSAPSDEEPISMTNKIHPADRVGTLIECRDRPSDRPAAGRLRPIACSWLNRGQTRQPERQAQVA